MSNFKKDMGVIMYEISGLIFLLIFALLSIVASIRNILIGKNIIKNPMYDNEEKRKYILRIGIICIIPLTVAAIFFLIVILMIGIGYAQQ
jgi:glucan phosphoethanolaminetransferase (alkaline phosphatase superfamily)